MKIISAPIGSTYNKRKDIHNSKIISLNKTESDDMTPKQNKLVSPVIFLTSSEEFLFKKNL
tara:strand:+ start:292 stop:474 length:183 start_codon:yes stop_codon:yes gene_type:complete